MTKRFDGSVERFRQKRRPLGSRASTQPAEGAYPDPSLNHLHSKGVFSEILYQHASGKEATIHVAWSEQRQELIALKVYTDVRMGSFKRDEIYREGRHISNPKVKHAIKQAKRFGVPSDQVLWIGGEYQLLSALHQAGFAVPEPIDMAGRVLAMQFIGDEDTPAPRLSDKVLDDLERYRYFDVALEQYIALLKQGYIHGDYSAYNLLLWQDKLYVIDFPQTIIWRHHPDPLGIMQQDIQGLCASLGMKVDSKVLQKEVLSRAGLSREFPPMS